jgi:RecA DNA recombination protein
MASLARADLEALLRARKLDRTLTSSYPLSTSAMPPDDWVVAATNLASFDARLGGGFPRGQLSELVGRCSSGRTSVLLQTLAAGTGRGELVALVDALDMLDVASASAAGVDLERLLWIRGHVVVNPGMCHDTNQRALEQAIKALSLVLQAGTFGLVVLDLAEVPPSAVRQLPFTTWLRLQRSVEGSQTACVLMGAEPMARSSAGLTVKLQRAQGQGPQARGSCDGVRFSSRLFEGLDIEGRVVRARSRLEEDQPVAVATSAAYA